MSLLLDVETRNVLTVLFPKFLVMRCIVAVATRRLISISVQMRWIKSEVNYDTIQT